MENYNFDTEVESPTTVLKESKQTMYINGEPLSPKLHLKAVGQEYLPQEREAFYRNTQPSFHISVEKTDRKAPKTRVETPKLDSSAGKQKIKTEQKDLLKEIANTQERRPNQMYIVQSRRLRNTANSFVSEQSRSSRHESIHNINTISANKRGNDDLLEVSIQKEKEIRKAREKQQQTQNYSLQKKPKNNQKPSKQPFQLTNLEQAYNQVTKLLETLPFQQNKLKPIVSASLDLKKIGRGSPVAATTAQEMLGQLRRSQHGSNRHLTKKDSSKLQNGALLRKPVKVPPPLGGPSQEESHQNSGHLHSNRSLSNGFPLQAIRSSIFRVEPAQDYTDLKLDFTTSNNNIMTEYQSQNFLESIKNMQSGAEIAQGKKVRIRQKFGDSKDQGVFMSSPGMQHVPLIVPTQPQINHVPRPRPPREQAHLMTDNSTEQHIMGILDKTDYHKLREHKDHSAHDGSSQQCTCYNQSQINKRASHSIGCQYRGSIHQQNQTYRLSTSPVETSSTSTIAKKKKASARNVLQIQLRPLKGKAALSKEYRSMIEEEYGKEKKKQIYETMYQEVHGSNTNANNILHQLHQQRDSYDRPIQQQYIKLNLRQELKPSPYVPKRNQHIKLQTISPRGDVQEKLVKFDERNAEQMNTTINSFGGYSTLRHSASRWKPNQMTQKQFFLFSPTNVQTSQTQPNTRYQSQPTQSEAMGDHQEEEKTTSLKPENNSIVNIEIATSSNKKQQHTQSNQIDLGYVGLHEQQQQNQKQHSSQAASDYFNYLMQNEDFKINTLQKNESSTVDNNETSPGHQNLPFGRIYSRISNNNNSKISRRTPKLASDQDDKTSSSKHQTAKSANRSSVVLKQSQQPPQPNVQKVKIKEQTVNKASLPSSLQQAVVGMAADAAAKRGRRNDGGGGLRDSTHSLVNSEANSNNVRQNNNSSLMNVQKSPSPALAAQQLNNYNRQVLAEKSMEADQLREMQLRIHEINTAGADDDEQVFHNASHIESLTNIHGQERDVHQSTTSDNENPMDRYNSQELLALQADPRFELFSNPTEVEIVHIANPKPQNDWEARKMKQAQFAEMKKLEQGKADESLGPLERKPMAAKDYTKHQQVSSITQISQFYNQQLPIQQVQEKILLRAVPKRESELSIISQETGINVLNRNYGGPDAAMPNQ